MTPPVSRPLPGWFFKPLTVSSRSLPRTISAFQSTAPSVSDTTCFFAPWMVRANGSAQASIQSGLTPVSATGRQALSIIS